MRASAKRPHGMEPESARAPGVGRRPGRKLAGASFEEWLAAAGDREEAEVVVARS
jgi:hypothetical protein